MNNQNLNKAQNHKMKSLLLVSVFVSLSMMLGACKTVELPELKQQASVQDDLLNGEWLTPCMTMGIDGQVNKIYSGVVNGYSYFAALTFENVGCTGNYIMKDIAGNVITAPVHENDAIREIISGIPADFYVYKITSVRDGSVIYVMFHFNGTSFTELVGNFSGPHADWNDWLSEPDVAGFVADPDNYVATQGYVIPFARGTLP